MDTTRPGEHRSSDFRANEKAMKPVSTSRAAVFSGSGAPFELREVPLPRLNDGECLVRVACCTICGSDLHTITGRREEPTPLILGHEIVGVVEQLSSQPVFDLRGDEIQIGDRVVWAICCGCHHCRNCRCGIPQKCEQLRKFGHQSLESNWPLSGGYAEHCQLPAGTSILRIGTELPNLVASPASCVTATAAAAIRKAGPAADDRILIFGAGLMGLSAAAMLQGDQRNIVVCDPNEERRELAKQFGADDAILDVSALDEHEKFDVILEMSGQPSAVADTLERSAIGGRIVLAGSVMPSPSIEFNPETIVRRLVQIIGVHNYAPCDLVEAVDFLTARHQDFPFVNVIEKTFPLTQIQQAVEYCLAEKPIRVAVQPH